MENLNIETEEIVELTKEEKLANAITFVRDEELNKKAKTLFKKGLFSKEVVEKFDENLYTDITIKPYSGYSLVMNEAKEMFYVKELKADSETASYGFELISFPNVTEEEYKILQNYKKPLPILDIVLVSLLSLFTLLSMVAFFINFFNVIEQGFEIALGMAFLYSGTGIVCGFGFLALYFKKNKKCKCRK